MKLRSIYLFISMFLLCGNIYTIYNYTYYQNQIIDQLRQNHIYYKNHINHINAIVPKNKIDIITNQSIHIVKISKTKNNQIFIQIKPAISSHEISKTNNNCNILTIH